MVAHKLKVDGIDLEHAQIYLDDKPIRAREVKIDMGVDRLHSATIEVNGVPDIDIEAYVTLDFTPETVEQAIAIIKSKLKNSDYVEIKELIQEIGELD